MFCFKKGGFRKLLHTPVRMVHQTEVVARNEQKVRLQSTCLWQVAAQGEALRHVLVAGQALAVMARAHTQQLAVASVKARGVETIPQPVLCARQHQMPNAFYDSAPQHSALCQTSTDRRNTTTSLPSYVNTDLEKKVKVLKKQKQWFCFCIKSNTLTTMLNL